MKTNVLCLLKNMDKKDVELQLALQCAPVITGIKVSNLFIIDKNKVDEVYNIIDETDISHIFCMRMRLRQTYFYTEKMNFNNIFSKKKTGSL